MKFLFPDNCVICERRGHAICPACASAIRPARDVQVPEGLESLAAAIAYDGTGRDVVTALKFGNRRGVIDWMAASVVPAIADPWRIDCITWMPSSRAGFRRRGFDPAKLLARAIGRSQHIPVRRLLARDRSGPQTSLDREHRLAGPPLRVLRAAEPFRSVLVVDDVCTTGSSLRVAAGALHGAGVRWVSGAVVAQTPRVDAARPAPPSLRVAARSTAPIWVGG
jgi:predicted amidophosphoribosyltransferase